MLIYVDIDETICHFEESLSDLNYTKAIPNEDAINLVNQWYDEGHTIIYWTARGTITGKDWFDLTEQQLKTWGAKYHQLKMGKPAYDLIVCDKTKRMDELL
jgi:hypothetical protein